MHHFEGFIYVNLKLVCLFLSAVLNKLVSDEGKIKLETAVNTVVIIREHIILKMAWMNVTGLVIYRINCTSKPIERVHEN